jgi:hypothetical protein
MVGAAARWRRKGKFEVRVIEVAEDTSFVNHRVTTQLG